MSDLDDDLNVDLTPLIDVIFMLVIFFIMTMSFTMPVIDFHLPQSTTAQNEHRTASVRISVDEHGQYTYQTNICTLEEITSIVSERLLVANENQEELSIELVIDSMTPTQYLISIADLARTYTQGRLLIVAEKSEQDSNTKGVPNTQDANKDLNNNSERLDNATSANQKQSVLQNNKAALKETASLENAAKSAS